LGRLASTMVSWPIAMDWPFHPLFL
jgi:hypothetical protein